jgi:hypothetical protein
MHVARTRDAGPVDRPLLLKIVASRRRVVAWAALFFISVDDEARVGHHCLCGCAARSETVLGGKAVANRAPAVVSPPFCLNLSESTRWTVGTCGVG